MSSESGKENEAKSVGSAIFADAGASFSSEMADKAKLIFDHFDRDKDERLNYEELRLLQLITSGADMTPENYEMACRALQCEPRKGVTLGAMKITYAAGGTDVDADYEKVFAKTKKASKSKSPAKAKPEDEDDDVIEVGEGGVDISS
mmetsp:Transcript_12965/g.38090  ORF Transcript_12965/g.38090 Transcript_12965/m.38090 type:complete len:147 (-) Transcript_12965:626-1066(-)